MHPISPAPGEPCLRRRLFPKRLRPRIGFATFLWLISVLALRADFQGATHMMPFDEDTINYSKAKSGGAVAQFQEQLAAGQVKLDFDPAYGYLPSLLKALGIGKDSQMLVFSKTSFQRERISPQTPRALYFNDEVYVGFIPGAPLVEVSDADPVLGAVFYTLDQSQASAPRLVRTDQCLECHASTKSMGVPGQLVRSFMTDESGVVDMASGISPINHRTPLVERWGGWYVTGTHGSQLHRGNLIGKTAFDRRAQEPNYRGNVTNLAQWVDTSRYMESGSDIVALMIFEHQTHMHNFITRLHYEATLALQQYGHVNYLKSATEAFLKYLLFTEETPLTAPVRGTSTFATSFADRGPKDRQGRSLRDLDLRTRLFKYPCSYLIYSKEFNALPAKMRERIYDRLWQILSGQDRTADFNRLTPDDRQAIREILIQTKPDLPDSWR